MKEEKWERRDRKRFKRRYGMQVDGRSNFLLHQLRAGKLYASILNRFKRKRKVQK